MMKFEGLWSGEVGVLGHQMIFNVPTASTATSKTSSARVDIFSDGLVQWVEGDDTTWLPRSDPVHLLSCLLY